MTFDDELNSRFQSAKEALVTEPGSALVIKERARRRSRRNRVALSAAAVLMVLGAGPLLVRWVQSIDEAAEVVETVTSDGDNNGDGSDTGLANQPSDPGTATDRLTEANLRYEGAFLLPADEVAESTFAFGGDAAAFNPSGDPSSDDGFDGSLFVSGHPTRTPSVAEVSIPEPRPHRGTSVGLPIAELLQPFADITGGRGEEFVGGTDVGGQDDFRYGGLEVVDGPAGPRLHWSIWQYQNASRNDVPGHGHSSIELDTPDPQGPWFLEDYSNLVTPGYVFTVPQPFADDALNGNRFITGFKSDVTTSGRSHGPPFFAYDPPTIGQPNERLEAIALGLYGDAENALADYGRADLTGGAAWVSDSRDSGGDAADGAAIVTVGRRGLGDARQGESGPDDCVEFQIGIHGGPYEPVVMFYDPADLARVQAGELEPHQLAPYHRWNPADLLIPTCEWELSSVSFDAENGRLYIVQTEADTSQNQFSPVPVVHVFSL